MGVAVLLRDPSIRQGDVAAATAAAQGADHSEARRFAVVPTNPLSSCLALL